MIKISVHLCANLIFLLLDILWIYFQRILKLRNIIFKLAETLFKKLEVKGGILLCLFHAIPFITLLPGVFILCLVHPSFRDPVRFRKRIRGSARLIIFRYAWLERQAQHDFLSRFVSHEISTLLRNLKFITTSKIFFFILFYMGDFFCRQKRLFLFKILIGRGNNEIVKISIKLELSESLIKLCRSLFG